MPPKHDLLFSIDFNGNEVRCKAQRNDLVTVGLDGTGPDGQRLTVKKKIVARMLQRLLFGG